MSRAKHPVSRAREATKARCRAKERREIHPVGYGYEASPFEPHGARLLDRYRYLTIVKLEIMCADEQLDGLLDVIQTSCGTGNPGDGMVFVSEIIDAMRIRDGARGGPALRSSPATQQLGRTS